LSDMVPVRPKPAPITESGILAPSSRKLSVS
jgi:hypothetical protein